MMELNWRITADEIKQARVEYTKDCPMLKDNSKQEALWRLYAIEKKSKQPALVLNLVNIYSRDRILHKNKTNRDLSIFEWVKTSLFVQLLTRNDKYKQNIISFAIKTFFARANSKIMFNTLHKTQDLAEPFAKYICDVSSFINKLCMDNAFGVNKCDCKPIVPFQIDLWIKSAKNIDLNDNSDEESDEESSEEEYDDDDDENEQEQKMNSDNAVHIADRLNANKIIYAQYENTQNQQTERLIQHLFEELRNKYGNQGMPLTQFMRSNRFVIIVERSDNDNEYVMVSDDDKYIMVSHNDDMDDMNTNDKIIKQPQLSETRKKSVNKTQFGDTLYLFMPNKGNKIPNDYCHEKFIQLSCDCVLPAVPAVDENRLNSTITAHTASNDFFMISWHVKQTDEMSCYQYQRGQINKFVPSDITNLWPYFFDSCGGINDKFFEHQKDETNKDSFVKKTKMMDHKFDHFCKIGFGYRETDKQ